MKRGGIPDERIVVMHYDDIAKLLAAFRLRPIFSPNYLMWMGSFASIKDALNGLKN